MGLIDVCTRVRSEIFLLGRLNVNFSFFRLENHRHDYRAVCLLLYLFVVMTEVAGRMQVSGGRAGNVLSFPLALVECKASHVARFCFSGLCATEAPSSLLDESWSRIVPQCPQGRAGAVPSSLQGPPGAALTSAVDKGAVQGIWLHGM